VNEHGRGRATRDRLRATGYGYGLRPEYVLRARSEIHYAYGTR
jgi:hypothetical protein